MSANPEQEEEFNIYAYIKQLIDGNDVSVLLRVADEVVSVMDVLKFYIPTLEGCLHRHEAVAGAHPQIFARGRVQPHLSGRAAHGS